MSRNRGLPKPPVGRRQIYVCSPRGQVHVDNRLVLQVLWKLLLLPFRIQEEHIQHCLRMRLSCQGRLPSPTHAIGPSELTWVRSRSLPCFFHSRRISLASQETHHQTQNLWRASTCPPPLALELLSMLEGHLPAWYQQRNRAVASLQQKSDRYSVTER